MPPAAPPLPSPVLACRRRGWRFGLPVASAGDPSLDGESRSASSDAGEQAFDVVIRPTGWCAPLRLGEVWASRRLLYFLAWRDVKVRYKQTVLGGAWAILQPLLTMVVLSVFFGRIGGLARKIEGDIPYPIYTLAALVPWTFFAQGMNRAANSLLGNARLLRKVYFPRLLVPLAAVVNGFVDLGLAFLVLVGMMPLFGCHPTLAVLSLPLPLVLLTTTTLGVGLWLSALNVLYRDVRFTLGLLTQCWLLATPIAYPSGLLRPPWRTMLGLNPMAGVVEGFRAALLGVPPPVGLISVSALVSAVVLATGAFYFRRSERSFADEV